MPSPPSKPNFTCASCRRCMCADCLSIAAEYEYLAQSRQLALMEIELKLNALQAELATAQHMHTVWKEMACMGQAEVIQLFLDSVVWQRVCQPPKREINRRLKKLEADIRQVVTTQRGDRP